MKKAITLLGILVLVALVALLLLPLWIGPLVTAGVNAVAPKYTKTAVTLENFAFNPYTGTLHVGGLSVENPDSFEQQRKALAFDNLHVEFDTSSLMGDVIHVQSIKLDGLFASYLFNMDGTTNVGELLDNITGDAPKAKEPQAHETEPAKTEAESAAETPKKSTRRVIIDRLEIVGTRVQLASLTIPVPSITLTDIGKESNGIEWGEVWKVMRDAVMNTAMSTGDAAKAALKSLGGAVDFLTTGDHVESAKEAVKSVKKLFNFGK